MPICWMREFAISNVSEHSNQNGPSLEMRKISMKPVRLDSVREKRACSKRIDSPTSAPATSNQDYAILMRPNARRRAIRRGAVRSTNSEPQRKSTTGTQTTAVVRSTKAKNSSNVPRITIRSVMRVLRDAAKIAANDPPHKKALTVFLEELYVRASISGTGRSKRTGSGWARSFVVLP